LSARAADNGVRQRIASGMTARRQGAERRLGSIRE
jgi:hypothetical protein